MTVTGGNLLATSSANLGKRPVKGLQRVNDTTLRFRVPKGLKATLKKVPFTIDSDDGTASKLLKIKSED